MNAPFVLIASRTYSRWFAFLVAIMLVIKPGEVAFACIWSPSDWEMTYSFFDPYSSENPDYVPFYFSLNTFQDQPLSREQESLLDWQKFLGKRVLLEDIRKLVYDVEYEELEWLLTSIQKSDQALSPDLAANSAARILKQEGRKSTVDYLLFARKCEPQVSMGDNYWEDPKWDDAEREWLIREGVDRYQAAPSDFLKLRYAFQVVRLAHYRGEYSRCIRLFDQLVAPIGAKGPLYYWSLAHKAGATRELGMKTEANYLFLLSFQHAPGMGVRAFRSLQIESQEDWDALLLACKTKEEQATLYLLRGLKPFSVALEEMEQISRIDPAFPGLQLLMAREINKVEYDFLGYRYQADFPVPLDPQETHVTSSAYIQQLIAFAGNQSGLDPAKSDWWKLASHYLQFVAGEIEAASTGLKGLEEGTATASIRRYARIYQLLITIGKAGAISPQEENTLMATLNNIHSESADPHHVEDKVHRFVFARLEKIYANQGEIGKSYLCQNHVYNLKYSPDEDVVRSLLDWLRRVNKVGGTDLDEHLLKRLDPDRPEQFLLEMAGTMALSRHEYSQAISDFEELGAVSPENFPFFFLEKNPFAPVLSDCQDCAGTRPQQAMGKLELARKMATLEKKATGQEEEAAARAAFELGVAWYNLSFFGHSWKTLRYFRSTATWYDMEKHEGEYWYADIDDTRPVLDMDTPLRFFQQVIDQTKDRELKAKALFFAAKCQQNQLLLQGVTDIELLRQEGSPFLESFEMLKTYKKTSFYKEAIGECGRFRRYVNNK